MKSLGLGGRFAGGICCCVLVMMPPHQLLKLLHLWIKAVLYIYTLLLFILHTGRDAPKYGSSKSRAHSPDAVSLKIYSELSAVRLGAAAAGASEAGTAGWPSSKKQKQTTVKKLSVLPQSIACGAERTTLARAQRNG